jgi:hypothetical protein
MFRLFAGFGVGCAAAGILLIGSLAGTDRSPVPVGPIATAIDRTNKTDALPVQPSAPASRHRVAVIEVVGVRDASIVYRDREGQVLFRTDPLSNVTVVVKNAALPEVTVRETVRTKVDEVPLRAPRVPAKKPDAPVGCETPFGPLDSPSPPAAIDRCISDAGAPTKFSAVWASGEPRRN